MPWWFLAENSVVQGIFIVSFLEMVIILFFFIIINLHSNFLILKMKTKAKLFLVKFMIMKPSRNIK